ncbi:hypothetical protein [Psychrobacter sp. 16-MNA-CIBAN-0192]|uniref:hypothetical protein n=1 Tax=Psychrobacter sp. 16-MNA-CIBAN-0192 TaxID=3140448 RepID=UPI00332796C7
MLVKFFRHGTGSGAGPLNYLLGSDRQRADAKVLYGDPVMTEQLINATPFKQKYKSGVLSFTEAADSFNDEQKMDIMQRFEKTLFAGLEPDQYDILWIEHSDKAKVPKTDEYGAVIEGSDSVGRLELNFLIPCMELRSGKSLQPFFAGADLVRVNALKNIINHEYKLTNPDDPSRKRAVNPYVDNAPRPTPFDVKRKSRTEKDEVDEDAEIIKNPPSHALLKQAIDRQLLRTLEQDTMWHKYAVVNYLRKLGLTIERQTERSISVSHPNIKKNIRLKGFMYEQKYDGARMQPRAKEIYQESFDYDSSRERRYRNDLNTWQTGMEKKEAYHQTLYGNTPVPEPLDLVIKASLPDHQLETDKKELKIPTPQPSYYPSP